MDDDDALQAGEQAIWAQDFATLAGLPGLDRATWAGSVQGDLVASGIDAVLRKPAIPLPAYPAAAVIMLMKDELDIIGHNLSWLYAVGFRRFVLSDNASADGTREEVQRFAQVSGDAEVVVIADPIVRYAQSQKTTAMLRFAATTWPDVRWVFPVDADEFLVPTNGLSALDAIPGDVDGITLPKAVHFRHTLGGEPDVPTPLARMALRSKLFIVPPKVACRADVGLVITQGNHGLQRCDGKQVRYCGGFQAGFHYREFQTRSFEHFLTKVRNGGAAIQAAERHFGHSVGGIHWLEWFKVLNEEGEGGLRRMYETESVRTEGPYFLLDPFHGVLG